MSDTDPATTTPPAEEEKPEEPTSEGCSKFAAVKAYVTDTINSVKEAPPSTLMAGTAALVAATAAAGYLRGKSKVAQ